jgi:biotin operon repressor
MSEEFEPEDLEPTPPDDPDRLAELEKVEFGHNLARIYLQSASELLASAKLEPDWLVPGAVPAGSVSFFVGKPGAAKSWLAYDLACATVLKRDWLGFGVPTAGDHPSALILNFDNPHAECGRRFLRLGLEPEASLWVHSWGAHNPPEPLPAVLQLPDAFDPLHAMIYAIRPSLVIIDSLRQAHTSDESSSQEMALIMSQAKRFALYGAAVVIIHHTRKGDGLMRGSTEIEATADSITDIEREDAQVSLVSWRKTRGWEMVESSMTVRVVDEGDRTFVRGGLNLTKLLDDGGLTRSDIAEELGLSQAATKKLIEKAMEKGLVKEHRESDGTRLIEVIRR